MSGFVWALLGAKSLWAIFIWAVFVWTVFGGVLYQSCRSPNHVVYQRLSHSNCRPTKTPNAASVTNRFVSHLSMVEPSDSSQSAFGLVPVLQHGRRSYKQSLR